MSNQIYFDQVSVGDNLPILKKEVTNVNIAMYCATVWLMDRIHFDYVFSTESRGLPDIVAPGNMAGDYYAQLLNEWAGAKGCLRKMAFQFRNFMLPGNHLDCGGKITKKYEQDGKGFVEVELWVMNEESVNCVPGNGVVELPLKA